MSERRALPIGSVVLVREGVDLLMMINHCPVTEKAKAQMKLGPFGLGLSIGGKTWKYN